jgi:hypothetical protein
MHMSQSGCGIHVMQTEGKDPMNGQNPVHPRAAQTRRAAPRAPPATVRDAAAPAGSRKHHDRHAAITDNLADWQNYKRWAEKIRNTWTAPEKLES